MGRTSITSPGIIASGECIDVHSERTGERLRLELRTVGQRNWSRIADGHASKQRVFVKQFVDAGGRAHERQWRFEQEGNELARRLLGPPIDVPRLLCADRDRLVHVYEYCQIVSLDDLLRETPERFDSVIPAALRAAGEALATLQGAAARAGGQANLPVKIRAFGGASDAVNFKGLDMRNFGVAGGRVGHGEPLSFAMFDFGRPYLAPIEEAAAKLFVSVGLLNWGRPIRRFARGPDTDLLAMASEQFSPHLNLEAVLAEIDYQRRTREVDVKARNWMVATLKNVGVKTLGRGYFRAMEGWCRRGLTLPQTL